MLCNPPTELKAQPTLEHFVIRELSEQDVELTVGVTVTWGGETHQAVEVVCRRKPGSEPLQNGTAGDGVRIPALCPLGLSFPHVCTGVGWGGVGFG